MITTTEAADRHGVARVTVRRWCQQGKIHGAIRIGRDWMIPATAALPEIGIGGKRMHKKESEVSEDL
jgi:excisionase family DNA binding protein